MAIPQREERDLLGHDAFSLIAPTHQPAIAALPPEELRAIATRLRAEHAKLRDLIREGHRAKRGKGDARAAANAEAGKATRRKQVYASALKRVNSRFDELTQERRRAEHRAALRKRSPAVRRCARNIRVRALVPASACRTKGMRRAGTTCVARGWAAFPPRISVLRHAATGNPLLAAGGLRRSLPRQGEYATRAQDRLAIGGADPLGKHERPGAAQQHGLTLQPGAKHGWRQIIRIQADGGEEPRHAGQVEAANAKCEVGEGRQHAAMGHVLAVAMALFNAQPKGERPVIPPDHDGADGFQKRPPGRARHEAFRDGGQGRLIQGRATFRHDRGRGDPIPEAR